MASLLPAELQSTRLIYLVEDGTLFAEYLAAHLEQAGYEVEVFNELMDLPQAVARRRPAACIVDLIFPEGDLAGSQTMAALNQSQEIPIPAIFMSVRDDQEARLSAVRAGGSHYFVKPIELLDLLSALDTLTQARDQEPGRVMIIEDEADLADCYRLYLEYSGVTVDVVTVPLQALDAIVRFAPDLILMDIFMPGCSGLELAAMLRQQHRFDGIPIVFLSSESDLDKQMAALNLGGDDFITKPVGRWQLVSALRPRIKRARELRSMQKQREAALRELEGLKYALDQHAIVSAADAQGRITYVNEKFCQASGYAARELLGERYTALNFGLHGREPYKAMWQSISNGNTWQGVVHDRRKDGSDFWMETTITPLLDEHGKPWQYLAICTEVTGIMQSQANASLAREEAEQASRAKSGFIASMSHELRTPLNTMLELAQAMEAGIRPEATAAEQAALKQLQQSGGHLLELINQMMALSSIEAGRVDLSMEWVSIEPMLSECIDFIRPLAAARGLSVRLGESACTDKGVFADAARLQQVLQHTLSNALKYNVAPGSIELACQQQENGWLRITVADTRPRLTEEQQRGLFQPVNRLGHEGETEVGAGVGLAVAHHLIRLMGGEIGVVSTPGQGSVFWVELPIASLPEHGSGAEVAGNSVLYVEDNPASIRLVSTILGRIPGMRLFTAHSAELGFEIACRKNPDLIILDVDHATVNGLALGQRLKRQPELKQARIIALSAGRLHTDLERIFAAGFDECLSKPIQVSEFTETIRRLLEQCKLLGNGMRASS